MISGQLISERLKSYSSTKIFDLFVIVVFAVFIVLAIRYQIKLLDYLVFGDEAETIVATKMMASGQKLYSEIFNHHGPLTFLPGMMLELFGDYGVPVHRVPIAVLQILAVVAIYFSPLLDDSFTKKAYATAASCVMLLFFPELFGSMYIYQVMAGLVIVVVLAQYTLPMICYPERTSIRSVFLGNILIACLPFFAITYVPAAFLLFASSLRRGYLAKSFYSIIGVALANVVFLYCVGSIAGFFAFHVYLNSEILPLYNGGQGIAILITNVFSSLTGSLTFFSFFLLMVAATSKLAKFETGLPWRSIFLGGAIASLLIRGLEYGFYGLPYYYSLLAFPLVFFAGRTIASKQSQLVVLLFLIACIVKVSLLIPGDKEKLDSSKNAVITEFSQLVNEVTNKNDRIIAYSFNNHEYIAADRLPASGNFFYLPWQEKYNESPKFGVKIDACKEISDYRPKVMLIDKWKVWDKYTWDSYAGCIQGLLDTEYVKYPDRPYYLRKDVAEAYFKPKVQASIPGVDVNKEISCEGSIDSINGVPPNPSKNTSNAVEPLSVRGWLAHSTQEGTLFEKIYVTLTNSDGASKYVPTNGQIRGDLGEFFKKPSLNAAGYSTLIDVTTLNGSYTLGIGGVRNAEFYNCSQIKIPVTIGKD